MIKKSQIGVIGLAVMGSNLARNFANKGFQTSVFNRSYEKTQELMKDHSHENLFGFEKLEDFIGSLESPRKIILMVKAGEAVDSVLEQITPLLNANDIVIDGGNSHFSDTEKRQEKLVSKNINFIGMGISGGEEGALNGPSMMPGGDKKAYQEISQIIESASASDGLGGKCVALVGSGASGHFVKMVHNGIEYAIMQLIAESYDLLKNIGKLDNAELSEVFQSWNKTRNLQSFLTEITAKIFQKKDLETGEYLIDLIKDQAQQKGTGKWTTFAAMDFGVSVGTVTAAVDCRILSGDPEMRTAGEFMQQNLIPNAPTPNKEDLVETVKNALTLGTVVAYDQGLNLIKKVAAEKKWEINLSEIVRIWRGGCIIRSDYLGLIQNVYSNNENQKNESLNEILEILSGEPQLELRKTINLGVSHGIPVLVFYNALHYLDSLIRKELPQNLTQAQRDFFGAHTYERKDKEGIFHTEWE